MEITFKNIVEIIKRNIIFIMILSFVFSAAAFGVTAVCIQKTYTSELKFYVETEYKTSTAAEDYQSINYAKNLVPTYIELLDSSTFYSEVSKYLDEKYTVSQIKSMISFKRIDNTEVFEAIVASKDPYEAKNIGDAVAQAVPAMIENVTDNIALKIVNEATVPQRPTSPNIMKNVLLAFFGGLILALVISFSKELLDIKIHYEKDMTMLFEVPILAVIPDLEEVSEKQKIAIWRRKE